MSRLAWKQCRHNRRNLWTSRCCAHFPGSAKEHKWLPRPYASVCAMSASTYFVGRISSLLLKFTSRCFASGIGNTKRITPMCVMPHTRASHLLTWSRALRAQKVPGHPMSSLPTYQVRSATAANDLETEAAEWRRK